MGAQWRPHSRSLHLCPLQCPLPPTRRQSQHRACPDGDVWCLRTVRVVWLAGGVLDACAMRTAQALPRLRLRPATRLARRAARVRGHATAPGASTSPLCGVNARAALSAAYTRAVMALNGAPLCAWRAHVLPRRASCAHGETGQTHAAHKGWTRGVHTSAAYSNASSKGACGTMVVSCLCPTHA